ncbi:DUF4783 domain-containing protein [Pedobacter sp.]|uniref:DUF4783 domain-containing protein n=1 Tax=Pedobacter sp. TaxID=1411316 RepID=UPI00396C7F20
MMKSIVSILVLLLHIPMYQLMQADIIDELANHFKAGNAKEIGKEFATSVELIIIDQEDVYNKAQAEQILKDFFIKNPPNKVTVIHRLNSSQNYRLGIFLLQTKTGKFRVTVTMKKNYNAFLISELRIDPDKE